MQNRIFNGLNYSLGNEDCSAETQLLGEDAGHAVCVAISGSQLIPFLAKRPRALTFVDVSGAQLLFAKLRLDLLRNLSFEEFLQFWGYPPYDALDLRQLRKSILAQVTPNTENNSQLTELLEQAGWQSPLYIGKWERTVVKLSSLYRALLGSEGMRIFDCNTLAEQEDFLKSRMFRYRWKAVINVASSLAATYAYLRPEQVPHQATASQFFSEYHRIFHELLTASIAKQNFFFQILLKGKISVPEACPLEAQREDYVKAKEWASKCDVRFVESDVVGYLENSARNIDFVALSNITSYFIGELSRNYLQAIKPSLNSGAHVVVRNFLHQERDLKISGYENRTHIVGPIFDQECTRVYSMSLFRKI